MEWIMGVGLGGARKGEEREVEAKVEVSLWRGGALANVCLIALIPEHVIIFSPPLHWLSSHVFISCCHWIVCSSLFWCYAQYHGSCPFFLQNQNSGFFFPRVHRLWSWCLAMFSP